MSLLDLTEYDHHVLAALVHYRSVQSREEMERTDPQSPLVRWMINYMPAPEGEEILNGRMNGYGVGVEKNPRTREWCVVFYHPLTRQPAAQVVVPGSAPPPPIPPWVT